jgi:AbiV family abortive infection protein
MSEDGSSAGSNSKVANTRGDLRLRSLCIDHAGDLIEAAERVLRGNGYPNIAYHLAVLAMEEIGKAGMIGARAAVGAVRDTAWMDKRLSEHISKLQWAIWSPALLGGRIDPKDFEEARNFALNAHSLRLAGLYVDHTNIEEQPVPPRSAVSIEQATSLVSLGRTRLEIEKGTSDSVIGELNENLKWFLDTVDSQLGADRLFSKQFIEKYAELGGDTSLWVEWARKEFDEISASEKESLAAELARVPKQGNERKPKWKVAVKVRTPSHTIRPKPLNALNSGMQWLKFKHVGKNDELLLEMTFPDSILLKDLYGVGLSFSKLCIAALNMGSAGLFWYELPRHVSRYYESIRDLDSPQLHISMERPWAFDERKRTVLEEKNLHHAMRCITVFSRMRDEEAAPIFGPYLHGLLLISKSDIHLSLEQQAHEAFVKALHHGMKHFGDWDGDVDTKSSSLHSVFRGVVPEQEHRERLFDALSDGKVDGARLLEHAMGAKRVTDLYLVIVANRLFEKMVQSEVE